MAIIQIPMGGRSIPVEIPDFSSEQTAMDILSELKSQTAILVGNLNNASMQNSRILNSINESTNAQREQSESSRQINANQASILQRMTGALGRVATTVSSETMRPSEQITKLLDDIGLPTALGALVGSIIGIVEELSSSMAGLNRIGAGIGMSFDELRNKAAGTGISLASVTKLIEKSGVTIAVLGDNTTEGSIRLLDMVSSLRSASREAGFFGLQSGELATLLVDEIELRRQIYSDEQLSMMLQRGLNQTLREVIINETAMARLTGQNVHERMLARQNFAADPSNAAALAMLEEGQREVANTAIQALGTFGPAMTDMMNKALANALMGRPTTMGNEQYAQVMPILEQMGINVEGMMSQLVQQVRSGNNDVAAVNESVFRITSSLTNLAEGDMEILRDLAVGGNQAAGTILQGRMQALAPEIDAVTGRFVGLENTIERTALAFDNGELKLQGMFGNVEEATQNFKQGIVNMLLGIAGIGTGPDEQGLRDRVTSIVDNYLALSESFRSGTDDPMALLQGLLTALSPSIPNLLSKPNQPPPASSDDIKTHFGPGSAMSTTLNTVAAATAQNTSVLERLISMLGRTGQ